MKVTMLPSTGILLQNHSVLNWTRAHSAYLYHLFLPYSIVLTVGTNQLVGFQCLEYSSSHHMNDWLYSCYKWEEWRLPWMSYAKLAQTWEHLQSRSFLTVGWKPACNSVDIREAKTWGLLTKDALKSFSNWIGHLLMLEVVQFILRHLAILSFTIAASSLQIKVYNLILTDKVQGPQCLKLHSVLTLHRLVAKHEFRTEWTS